MQIKEISNGHQHIKFNVSGVNYTAVFIQQEIDVFEDDIIQLIQGQTSIYSVVFAVSAYLENDEYQGDFYEPPLDVQGKRITIDILQLQSCLQNALYQHYLEYLPQCYVFHGNSSKLSRFYQKICSKPKSFLLDFVCFTKLGQDKNGFVVQTPKFIKEKTNE